MFGPECCSQDANLSALAMTCFFSHEIAEFLSV